MGFFRWDRPRPGEPGQGTTRRPDRRCESSSEGFSLSRVALRWPEDRCLIQGSFRPDQFSDPPSLSVPACAPARCAGGGRRASVGTVEDLVRPWPTC
ncbi:hypothetical protein CURTO8I2_250201 [Curtobacterium sp. 8I-2]|nr:hypothetical protein CURTO8I2_250201 [Curtobacterium sp. 8I-2]